MIPDIKTVVSTYFSRASTERQSQRGVKYWAALGRKAVALKMGRLYHLWVALWHLVYTENGPGWWIITDDWIVRLSDLLAVHPRTIRRYLDDERAEGVFWRHSAGRLYFVRQEKAAAGLAWLALAAGVFDAAEHEHRNYCEMSPELLAASHSRFCAEILAGWLAVHKGQGLRITWELLEEAWGRSRPGILKWMDQLVDLTVTENVGARPLPRIDARDIPALYRLSAGYGEPGRQWYGVREFRGIKTVWEFWRRGNTYAVDRFRRGARGRAAHVRSALHDVRDAASNDDGGQYLPPCQRGPYERTNHDTSQSYQQARRRRPELARYVVDDRRLLRSGRTLQIFQLMPALSTNLA